MKKYLLILMIVCIMLSMCACGSEASTEGKTTTSSVESETEKTSTENETISLNEFCSEISGIWVNFDNASESHYEFMDTSNGSIGFGAYPGGGSRVGKITDVVSLGNNSYKITLYYPEEEWYGDIEPEIEETHTVTISSGTLQFDGSETIWTYMGSGSYEEIMLSVQQKLGSSQGNDAFPKMDYANHLLGSDIADLQALMSSGGFQGPNSSYGNMAGNIFYLKETDSMDFYLRWNNSHILGMKDGKLELEGWWYDSPFSVRTLVGNDAASPVTYTVVAPSGNSPGYQAYVWKIDDGYMALIVAPIYQSWYDNYVYSRIDISDIKHLEYVDASN